jgi:Type II secretion system (T2SS), protein E, N-terminal domain
MQTNQYSAGQEQNEQFSLLCIALSEESAASVRRVARRICRNVRRSDCVLYAGRVCAVVFSGTPLTGAQAATRRLCELLVDVEYELQVLSGAAAVTMLQHLRAHQTVVVQREEDGDLSVSLPVKREGDWEQDQEEGDMSDRDTLPQLSVLSQYPAPRILHLFPYELARRYRCVPVGADRAMLTLATCQRLEAEVVTYFQEVTRRNIFLVRCESNMIEDVLLYWQRIMPIQPYAASK